jgi:gamma-glutamyltranspeptidase / glutathione hydrolase
MRGSRVMVVAVALALPSFTRAAPVAGMRGMVATAHPLASEAGTEMLRAGGNAADAAIASAFVLAVVEPYSSGLGGGGLAIIRIDGKLVFLDFREVAPAMATRDMYVVNGALKSRAARRGPLAAAVPGAVLGYLEIQSRFGKLPRARVLEPAIRLAELGFPVYDRLRSYIKKRLNTLSSDSEAARIFLTRSATTGALEPPGLGQLLIQPDLAATLRILARDGAAAFYTGAIAQKLAADMTERGGVLSLEDLKAFKVRERPPLVGSFFGHAIATASPPSAGGAALLTILNVLETAPESTRFRDPAFVHLYIEASKRAFADRALVGDPAFVPDVTPRLVAKDRARMLAKMIESEARATPAAGVQPGQGAFLPSEVPAAAPVKEGHHTTHLCAVDKHGDAVSLTTTINTSWGAAIVARGTGILWNDEMDDFAIASGVSNAFGVVGAATNMVGPGKIPVTSMAPTIVFEGRTTSSPVRLVVGAPSGPKIPTTIAQVISNYIQFGANISTAIITGRIHNQHLPDRTTVEPYTLDPLTRDWLTARGHTLKQVSPWSDATAIAINPSTALRTGAADTRGVGSAAAE